jgi:ATP-dependent Lhr-like helicase
MLADPSDWHRFPDDVREWLGGAAAPLPLPARTTVGRDLPARRRHYMIMYSFEGWNAHQRAACWVTKRWRSSGLSRSARRQRLCAVGYGMSRYDPPPPLSRHPRGEFVEWVEQSMLLKRAFAKLR